MIASARRLKKTRASRCLSPGDDDWESALLPASAIRKQTAGGAALKPTASPLARPCPEPHNFDGLTAGPCSGRYLRYRTRGVTNRWRSFGRGTWNSLCRFVSYFGGGGSVGQKPAPVSGIAG